MKGDIPVCKRCCCCLPLRHGLLAWSYIKIIAEGVIIPVMVGLFLNLIVLYAVFIDKRTIFVRILLHFLLSLCTFASLIADFVATIVFIVGVHKKKVKLLKGFFFYSIAMLMVTILLIISSVCVIVAYSNEEEIFPLKIDNVVVYSIYSVILVLQTYYLLLVRSELIQLRNSGQFRFVNNRGEAECNMILCDGRGAGHIVRKETEDVCKEEKTPSGSMEKDQTRLVN